MSILVKNYHVLYTWYFIIKKARSITKNAYCPRFEESKRFAIDDVFRCIANLVSHSDHLRTHNIAW